MNCRVLLPYLYKIVNASTDERSAQQFLWPVRSLIYRTGAILYQVTFPSDTTRGVTASHIVVNISNVMGILTLGSLTLF